MTTPEELAAAVAEALRTQLPDIADRIAAASFCMIDGGKLAEIRVTVSAVMCSQTPVDRDSADDRETTIEIAVQQRAKAGDDASLAGVRDTANAIAALFAGDGALRDATFADSTFVRLERNPILRPDHLYELNIATAPLSLTFTNDQE